MDLRWFTATSRLAQVYVVRVGDVFVVADPKHSLGAPKAQLVLDRNLTRVATVAK